MNLESKKLIRRTVGILILFLIMVLSICAYNNLQVNCYQDNDGDKIGNTKMLKKCFFKCYDGYVEIFDDPDDDNKKCREKDDLACKKASYCAELTKVESEECLPKFKLFVENRGERDLVTVKLSPSIVNTHNGSVIPILPKEIPILLSKENSESSYSEIFTLNKLVELRTNEYEFSIHVNMPEIVSDTILSLKFTLPNCGKINLNDPITERKNITIGCNHRILHQLSYENQKTIIYQKCSLSCVEDSITVSVIDENGIFKIHPTIPIVNNTTETVIKAEQEVVAKKTVKDKSDIKQKKNRIPTKEEPRVLQKDCLSLDLNIGDSCNDKNPKTEEDKVLEDCICAGYIRYDCQTLRKNIGDVCDDSGNITKDCICEVKTEKREEKNDNDTLLLKLKQMEADLVKQKNAKTEKINECNGNAFSRQAPLCESELREMRKNYNIKYESYQNLLSEYIRNSNVNSTAILN